MRTIDIRDRLAAVIINLRAAQDMVGKAKDCISEEDASNHNRAIMQLGAVEERLRDIDEAQLRLERYLMAFMGDVKEQLQEETKHD